MCCLFELERVGVFKGLSVPIFRCENTVDGKAHLDSGHQMGYDSMKVSSCELSFPDEPAQSTAGHNLLNQTRRHRLSDRR